MWNSFVESRVAKLDPSKMAVYATARPNAVLNEWAEAIVSSEPMPFESGSIARTAAMPAVKFV
jgi:hypothetical protein